MPGTARWRPASPRRARGRSRHRAGHLHRVDDQAALDQPFERRRRRCGAPASGRPGASDAAQPRRRGNLLVDDRRGRSRPTRGRPRRARAARPVTGRRSPGRPRSGRRAAARPGWRPGAARAGRRRGRRRRRRTPSADRYRAGAGWTRSRAPQMTPSVPSRPDEQLGQVGTGRRPGCPPVRTSRPSARPRRARRPCPRSSRTGWSTGRQTGRPASRRRSRCRSTGASGRGSARGRSRSSVSSGVPKVPGRTSTTSEVSSTSTMPARPHRSRTTPPATGTDAAAHAAAAGGGGQRHAALAGTREHGGDLRRSTTAGPRPRPGRDLALRGPGHGQGPPVAARLGHLGRIGGQRSAQTPASRATTASGTSDPGRREARAGLGRRRPPARSAPPAGRPRPHDHQAEPERARRGRPTAR